MKKKIFFQVFSVALIVIVLMFSFSLIAVYINSENIVKQRLEAETKLAVSLLKNSEDFSAFDVFHDDNKFRITIFDLDGNVLYESDTNSPLENHADREEIKSALAGTPITVERYSDTFKCKMTYYAKKTTLDDNVSIVLRLAVKSSEIATYLNLLAPLFVIVLLIAVCVSFLLSRILSKNITAKINQVGDSLESLNSGKYEPLCVNTNEPELYAILDKINELNLTTHNHILAEESEHHKLNSVLDNISQGILALNKQKEIVFFNKTTINFFDGVDKVKDKDFIFLIDNLTLYNQICDHLDQNYNFEYNYNDKYLSVSIVKIEEQKLCNNISNILVFTDITKEKEIAIQKSDFFANASHELKTPITVMQGLSEVLAEKELDSSSKKQVDRIHKECLRLASLIADMLKLSKLEMGETQEELICQKINLREIAEEVVSELSSEMQKKSIATTINGNASFDADPKKFYDIIVNLCSNAVHYNKEGGTITIDLQEKVDSIELVVADSGIGIDKEQLPRLCERFYRVDKSHSKKTGGTGLGLAIVKHTCAFYNATLDIQSQPNIGTTVKISFPKKTQ